MSTNIVTEKQAAAIDDFFFVLDYPVEDFVERLDYIFLNALNDVDNPPSASDFLLIIELKKLIAGIHPITQP